MTILFAYLIIGLVVTVYLTRTDAWGGFVSDMNDDPVDQVIVGFLSVVLYLLWPIATAGVILAAVLRLVGANIGRRAPDEPGKDS